MDTFFNNTDFLAPNTSAVNATPFAKCYIDIPLASWDSSSLDEPSKVSTILAIATNVVTMPLTIFFNALIIFVVWKHPSLQIERVIVLAYLAFTDLLVGLISQSMFIAREALQLNTMTMNCDMNTAYFFFGFLLVTAAFYQLVVVTYERYVAIIHPFKYPTRITVKGITYATIGLWALNTPVSISYFILLAFHIPVWYIDIVYIVVALVLTNLMVYWYVKMFAAIRRQKRQLVPQHQNASTINPHTQPNHKGAQTAALLLACFVASFVPQMILFIVKQVLGFSLQGSLLISLQPWVLTFVNLGSFFNPIIYGVRTKELRRKCLKVFGFNANVAAVQNAMNLNP